MPRLPVLSYRKVARLLRRHGFRIKRQTGSHQTWTDGHRFVTVPRHTRDIGPGLLLSIMEQAGLQRDDLP